MMGSGRLPSGSGDNYNFHAGGEIGVECDGVAIDGLIVYDGSQTRVGYNGGATNMRMRNCVLPGGLNATNAEIVEDTNNDLTATDDGVWVMPSEVIANRANIVIKNATAQAESVTVDVSSVLAPGDNYQLHNVRDYHVNIASGMVGQDGTIVIDMRAASHSMAVPVALDVIANGFPGFGAFVARKI
jgi:hypothetical protein